VDRQDRLLPTASHCTPTCLVDVDRLVGKRKTLEGNFLSKMFQLIIQVKQYTRARIYGTLLLF